MRPHPGVSRADGVPHDRARAVVHTRRPSRFLARGAGPASGMAPLDALLEATVAMSARAHEPEQWEAVLRRLVD